LIYCVIPFFGVTTQHLALPTGNKLHLTKFNFHCSLFRFRFARQTLEGNDGGIKIEPREEVHEIMKNLTVNQYLHMIANKGNLWKRNDKISLMKLVKHSYHIIYIFADFGKSQI
jgi:hypothetical protein